MALAARERAERFAWPHVAAEVLDSYEQAISLADPSRRVARGGLSRAALRHGFAPADLQPRVPRSDLPRWRPSRRRWSAASGAFGTLRRAGLRRSLAGAGLAALALQRVGVTRVAARCSPPSRA